MKALVIGGTLFIGRGLVEELLKLGHEVWVLHRKPKHSFGNEVGNLAADRNDAASLRSALQNHSFDVVFDNVYDWERGTTAAQVEATARACGDNLRRYIFMSSVAAYGDGLNHRERDPLAPDDHPLDYIRNKAASERALFRLHERDGFPTVTFRPPFVYGPSDPFYRTSFFWDRLRAGRPIILPDGGDGLMQFVFVKDLVAACLRAMETPEAVGEAFNVGDLQPVTQAQFIEALASVAGLPLRTVSLDRERILAAGGNPMTPPKLYFGEYYDVPPITEIIEKAPQILDFEPTRFHAGLKETYTFHIDNPGERTVDFSFEDQLLANA